MLMIVMNVTIAKTFDKGEIKFKRGSYSGTVSGSVVRGDRDQYSLMAFAGQWMEVKISSPEDNAVFQLSIYSYGTGEYVQLEGAKDEDDAKHWYGKLPTPGCSKDGKQNAVNIVVGGTRGNTSYDLTVTIKNQTFFAAEKSEPSILVDYIEGTVGGIKIRNTPSKRLSEKINLMAADWEKMQNAAQLGYKDIQSWLPKRGIRGRYQIAKKVMSKTSIESIVGEKAFLIGPHEDGISYTSAKEFGRYNPDFLMKLQRILTEIFNNKIFVARTQKLYDSQLKQYLRTYYLAYDVAANNRKVMDGYLSVIKETQSSSDVVFLAAASFFLQESFRHFAESVAQEGYDVYEAFVCAGFWIRRSIDGTEDEFFQLLKLTINTFDENFLKNLGVVLQCE